MVSNKKALVVGINDYPGAALHGCVNDAQAVADVLSRNGDSSLNFEVRLGLNVATRSELKRLIEQCFSGDAEVALLYFSGHGFYDEKHKGGYLVTPDYTPDDPGVRLDDILQTVNESKCRNRVVILDCCYSGAMGRSRLLGGASALEEGVTILCASRKDETAAERAGSGVFTDLLVEALYGAAADITGHVTPGGVYAFVDKALGLWEQRPVFKTNVTSFMSLRDVEPQVELEVLRRMADYFPSTDCELSLDPSFEPTNTLEVEHEVVEPYADGDNVAVFSDLQKLEGAGLVRPVGEDHMYYAAMHSGACRLTALGRQYWRLAKGGKI